MIRCLGFTWTVKLVLTLALFSRCTDSKPIERKNGINRIVFATGGCFGPCPVQIFDIDSSLSVKYNGIQDSRLEGFHKGKISQEFWDSLNIKFENINYKELDSAYNQSVDGLTTELMIYYRKSNKIKIKYIHGQSSNLPDSVGNVYDWLLERLDTITLTQTKDSLVFPTYLDKPPIRTIIKFLPPKIDSDK